MLEQFAFSLALSEPKVFEQHNCPQKVEFRRHIRLFPHIPPFYERFFLCLSLMGC